jgi:hypothetical protein
MRFLFGVTVVEDLVKYPMITFKLHLRLRRGFGIEQTSQSPNVSFNIHDYSTSNKLYSPLNV